MPHTLRAKYPRDFTVTVTVTPAQARAWREEQIAQCLKEGKLDAAFFHRDWLIAEMVTAAAKKSRPDVGVLRYDSKPNCPESPKLP